MSGFVAALERWEEYAQMYADGLEEHSEMDRDVARADAGKLLRLAEVLDAGNYPTLEDFHAALDELLQR